MKPQSPLSLRLEPQLLKRLEECSKRTKIKKYTLAITAIEAAVEAIEKNDFFLVVPIQFDVARVPLAKRPGADSSSATGDTESILRTALDKDLKRTSGGPPKGKR